MKRLTLLMVFVFLACFVGCGSKESIKTPNAPAAKSNVQKTVADPGPKSVPPSVSETEGIELRYRFVEGQRMDYIMSMETDNDIINLGQKTKNNMDFYFHVTVDAVEADGSAVITQINDRFKLKVKGPGGTITYDSADGEESDHPQWQGLRQVYLPMQYAQCTYRVAPSGVVSDVKPTAELAERLEKDPSMAGILTQQQLEQNAFALFHPMPAGAVAPGATWNYPRNVAMGPLKLEFVFTKTFRATAEQEGRQVVDITETVVSKEIGEGTPAFDYKQDDEKTFGQEYFDPQLGWLVSMNDRNVFSTKQGAAGGVGRAIESHSSTQLTIQLQPSVIPQKPSPVK